MASMVSFGQVRLAPRPDRHSARQMACTLCQVSPTMPGDGGKRHLAAHGQDQCLEQQREAGELACPARARSGLPGHLEA